MPEVSSARTSSSLFARRAYINHVAMALCIMGGGLGRSPNCEQGRSEVCSRPRGLLHEVDRGRSLSDHTITRFLWKSMVCMFGIPRSLISDNGDNSILATIVIGALSWNKSQVLIPRPPVVQRIGRGDQQDSNGDLEEEADG